MIDTRPIISVRFRSTVNLGYETEFWSAADPHYGFGGKITVRVGDPDKGEPRTSLIFELRAGKTEAHVDVEVRESNIAQINRAPWPEKPAAKGGAK